MVYRSTRKKRLGSQEYHPNGRRRPDGNHSRCLQRKRTDGDCWTGTDHRAGRKRVVLVPRSAGKARMGSSQPCSGGIMNTQSFCSPRENSDDTLIDKCDRERSVFSWIELNGDKNAVSGTKCKWTPSMSGNMTNTGAPISTLRIGPCLNVSSNFALHEGTSLMPPVARASTGRFCWSAGFP